MGEVVNLRRVRKAHDRTAKEAQAAANRVAFGRTKARKRADVERTAQQEAMLDGAKRER